jgi:ABC-2 type transport system ATP-binding protein
MKKGSKEVGLNSSKKSQLKPSEKIKKTTPATKKANSKTKESSAYKSSNLDTTKASTTKLSETSQKEQIQKTFAVEITDLSKIYKTGVQALKKVNLNIEHGDFFALLGVNGAGKTTMLGIMAGLVNKTSGSVKIYGFDTEFQPSLSKMQIGLVPQEFNFNIFEKVLDIVVSQAGFYGIPKAEATIRATKILSELGLGDKLSSISQDLSGGMKRRLMIARALVHQPRLLILDEPTAGVDVELRRGMWNYLNQLNSEGTTILLTTHYLEEAEQLCRNVAIIDHGNIVRQGNVKALLSGVDKQTFTIEIDKIGDEKIDQLYKSKIPLIKVDNDTIEIEIRGKHSLGEVLGQIIQSGVQINSIQPKENRLEELFFGIVNKK